MSALTRNAAAVAAAIALTSVSAAFAQMTWNERTTLKFSDPVMVPGATLQPGSYLFKLADMRSNRHTVQILSEDGNKVVATVHAVPVKRLDVKGDIVVRFKATDAGSPPAMAAYFYPGSTYGHQFIYPDAQAKEISGRSKAVVLSSDASDSDMSAGKLHIYNESGVREEWKEDAATKAEWDKWRKAHPVKKPGALN